MRIVEIRVHQHDIDVKGGTYQMSVSSVTALDTTVVELVTDVGLSGFGETCPLGSAYQPQHARGARAAISEVAPAVVGHDPRRIGVVGAAMDEALQGHGYAKAAIDIACWDLAGKAYGARVCDLLGGARTEQVRSYYGILPDTPEGTAGQAVARMDEGFPRLQLKAGGRPLDDDVVATRAVAEVLRPGVSLLVDANRGWTVRDAVLFSQQCSDIPLTLEQPCATLDEHRALRGRVAHPVFLDESANSLATILTAVDEGLAQGFGLKVSRVGGLSAGRAVRDVCAARRVPHTVDDTWGGDLTAAACIHLGATLEPALFEGTWIAEPYSEASYAVVGTPIRPSNGCLGVPAGPGLGVVPDLGAWPDPIEVVT